MTNKKFELIKRNDKSKRTSLFTREYIIDALDVYCWNEETNRSEVINKLLEDFLRREGYMNSEGEVLRERIF